MRIGQKVNIETDILAKYVEKMINHSDDENKFSEKWFQELGF
jgi:riboflavin synthase alpha subunit